MPLNFTKRKFLSFPLHRQHKKCAELLRELSRAPSNALFSHYNETQEWMGRHSLTEQDQEQVSNRFHEHLRLAGQSVKEHNLLSLVKRKDRSEPIRPPLPVTVYLEKIRSAHNVGSILRTIEAFSLGEACFSPSTPYIDIPQVKKASMGASRFVRCSQEDNLDNLPKPLIVMETCKGSVPLREFSFPDRFTLAVGNEEFGCSRSLLEAADAILEIPLYGRKNSLNVANAFAIAAAEIAAQKDDQPKGLHGTNQ